MKTDRIRVASICFSIAAVLAAWVASCGSGSDDDSKDPRAGSRELVWDDGAWDGKTWN